MLPYLVEPPGSPQEAAAAENWMAGGEAEPRTGESKTEARAGGSKTKGSVRMTSQEERPG